MVKKSKIELDRLLKAIENGIKPLFISEIRICSRCGHSIENHYWNGGGRSENSGYDSCLCPGCECPCLVNKGETKTIVDEESLNILLNKISESLIAFKETEEGQTHSCPFCEATKKVAAEQIKILKQECEEMKRERDLARRILDEERKQAYNHGYATGQHDCEEALEEGKEEEFIG